MSPADSQQAGKFQLACPVLGEGWLDGLQNRLDLERPVNTEGHLIALSRVYSFSSGPQTGLRPRANILSVLIISILTLGPLYSAPYLP